MSSEDALYLEGEEETDVALKRHQETLATLQQEMAPQAIYYPGMPVPINGDLWVIKSCKKQRLVLKRATNKNPVRKGPQRHGNTQTKASIKRKESNPEEGSQAKDGG